ncbi:EcsC family protein [Echinicola jeungdonensis]|uniref:EcsC family protein n=1 Tax=Echinicola jeungdonensis TaxID=709343 RepID=A0ABV5J053_9BACT|nr:EcsC family protein [Echinicola jeungdonensis]MDN3671188.1 EcsC family protein [Echinicola jeungdonensis]
MVLYEEIAFNEMNAWLKKVKKNPSIINRMATGVQHKINDYIPEKVHQAITYAVEKMVKGVIFGSSYINATMPEKATFEMRESRIKEKIKFYQRTASVEGAVTGAGGILWGFVDFPAFFAIKMKLMFEIASLYGYDVKDLKERLFILYIFQLAFCSQKRRKELAGFMENWPQYSKTLPKEESEIDWRTFQIEYRDYMDLAKLAQLIPVIGAGVGAITNYRLADHLGKSAMQCYRIRYFDRKGLLDKPIS